MWETYTIGGAIAFAALIGLYARAQRLYWLGMRASDYGGETEPESPEGESKRVAATTDGSCDRPAHPAPPP